MYTELANDDLKELRRIGLQMGYKAKKFRSIYWALLLNVLGKDPYHWLNERRQSRNEYAVMREQFHKNPYQQLAKETTEAGAKTGDAAEQDNPLSQKEESVWHQHFCDQELTKLINQDVARTFPSVAFFRQPELQSQMANILFAYARAHPKICYRQGMHELLAPLLYVLHTDHRYLMEVQQMTNCVK